MEFHIGQRVKAIKKWDGNPCIVGVTGVIRDVTHDMENPWWGVEFDEDVEGHDLNGKLGYCCDFGHGYFCSSEVLVPIDSFPVGLEELI